MAKLFYSQNSTWKLTLNISFSLGIPTWAKIHDSEDVAIVQDPSNRYFWGDDYNNNDGGKVVMNDQTFILYLIQELQRYHKRYSSRDNGLLGYSGSNSGLVEYGFSHGANTPVCTRYVRQWGRGFGSCFPIINRKKKMFYHLNMYIK